MQKNELKQPHVHRSGTAGPRCTDTSPGRNKDPNGTFFTFYFSFLFISSIFKLSFHFRRERPRAGQQLVQRCAAEAAQLPGVQILCQKCNFF